MIFYSSDKKTNSIWYPAVKDVFSTFEDSWKKKLIPICSIPSQIFNPDFPDFPVHIIHHNVGMDWIKSKWEGKTYQILEMKGNLKIAEIEKKYTKKAFLNHLVSPKIKILHQYHYNDEGLLVFHDEVDQTYKNQARFEWKKTNVGFLLDKKINISGLTNEKLFEQTFIYDEQGYLKKSRIHIFPRKLEIIEKFNYQTDPKGNISISKDTDDQFLISFNPKTRTISADGLEVYLDKNYTKEEFLKKVTILSRIDESYGYKSKNGLILGTFSNNATKKVDILTNENHELVSISYQYERLEEIIEHDEVYVVENKEDGEFLVKLLIEGKVFYSYHFKPFNDGFQIELWKDDEKIDEKFVLQCSKQEAICSIADLYLPLIQRNTDVNSFTQYQMLTSFEKYPDGKIKTRTVTREENPLTKYVEIETQTPIPWIQQDATPLNDAGEKMQYLGRFKSPFIFGYYFLFVDIKSQTFVQVFQCS